MKITICGKGGCGKSTVTSLLAKALARRGKEILVIDSDESNYGLHRQLGMKLPRDFTDYFGGKQNVLNDMMLSKFTHQFFEETWTIDDIPEDYYSLKDGVKLMTRGWIWRGTAVWDKGNSRPQKGRFRQQAEYIVWGSNGPMPINRPVSCLPGVFRYGNPQNRIHVTEKPLQLMKDVIQICEPRGLILDPFVGAGTTVLAAVMTGYRAVGIEVTDAYYKLGSDRVKIALEAEQKEDEK